MPAAVVMQAAYSWPSQRIVWSDPAPPGQFDFIANLPSDGLKALQDEIKKQWGLVGELQNLHTNVLVLSVERTNAPGLQPADGPGLGQGTIRIPLASLLSIIENSLRVLIVDQTGLTGLFDIPSAALQQGLGADRLDKTRRFLSEQLGLAVTETNMAVEMLVVRKAAP
jgi:hypothetical protein